MVSGENKVAKVRSLKSVVNIYIIDSTNKPVIVFEFEPR